jgi:hypothetical protein
LPSRLKFCYVWVFFFLFLVLLILSLHFLVPILTPSLSVIFLCYSTLFSFSQLFFLPLLNHSLALSSPPSSHLPQSLNTLPLASTHSPPTDQPTLPTIHTPNPL